jgi:dihydroflavonol-4-reductase
MAGDQEVTMSLKKTAFVTGGTGFVGLNLVEELSRSGWDVTALHRPNSELAHLQKYPVRLVEGEIEDMASLGHAFPKDVDAVFHVAGDTSMWSGNRQRQWRTNVDGTRNMVEAALAKGAQKFIHTSTSGVFGLPSDPFDETALKLGKGGFHYQHSKAMAEEEVSKAVAKGLDAVILNPANIIGRYDWNSWSQFIRKAANRQLPLIPPGSACFCDVGAVVKAHITAVDKGRIGQNYLLGGDRASYREIVEIVGRLLGRPINTRVGRPFGFRLGGRALDRLSSLTRKEPMITAETGAFLSSNIICRSDKAMRELDYRPASVESMVKDCIDWMIAEKRLDLTVA